MPGLTREWAEVPPRPVRLDQLITTKAVLDLRLLLDLDSTFYGDLFPHVIRWHGELYLEDGLHRALGAALHQRSVLHARVLDLDAAAQPATAYSAAADSAPARPAAAFRPRHSAGRSGRRAAAAPTERGGGPGSGQRLSQCPEGTPWAGGPPPRSLWRWRWDLNPRKGCPFTRFRGVRPRPLGDSTADEPT